MYYCVVRRRIHASRSAALQMVDEKARVVLKKSEFNTLTYYLDEYSARQMTIEAFVAVLLELLNTPEKVKSLLSRKLGITVKYISCLSILGLIWESVQVQTLILSV